MVIAATVGQVFDTRYRLLAAALSEHARERLPDIHEFQSPQALAALDVEFPNITNVMDELLDTGGTDDLQVLTDLYLNIGRYLSLRGVWERKRDWGLALLERTEDVDATVRAGLLNNVGVAYDDLGDQERAITFYEHSLSVREGKVSGSFVARGFSNLGAAYWKLGQHEKALDYARRALEIERRGGDKNLIAMSLGNIAGILYELWQMDEALELVNEALDLVRESGNVYLQAQFTSRLATQLVATLQLDEAVPVYEDALHLLAEVDDEVGLARTKYNYAVLPLLRLELEKSQRVRFRKACHEVVKDEWLVGQTFPAGDEHAAGTVRPRWRNQPVELVRYVARCIKRFQVIQHDQETACAQDTAQPDLQLVKGEQDERVEPQLPGDAGQHTRPVKRLGPPDAHLNADELLGAGTLPGQPVEATRRHHLLDDLVGDGRLADAAQPGKDDDGIVGRIEQARSQGLHRSITAYEQIVRLRRQIHQQGMDIQPGKVCLLLVTVEITPAEQPQHVIDLTDFRDAACFGQRPQYLQQDFPRWFPAVSLPMPDGLVGIRQVERVEVIGEGRDGMEPRAQPRRTQQIAKCKLIVWHAPSIPENIRAYPIEDTPVSIPFGS